jgi:hypothetical protein
VEDKQKNNIIFQTVLYFFAVAAYRLFGLTVKLQNRIIPIRQPERNTFLCPKFEIWKEVTQMVELDQFKTTLNTYKEPLVEVRDSL